jgi:hypothetical protein
VAVSGYGIGIEIQQALGLPPETSCIDIHIGLNEVVEVTCSYYPSEDAVRKVLTILQRYNLVEKEGPAVSPEHAAARERDHEVHGRASRLRRLREQLKEEQE